MRKSRTILCLSILIALLIASTVAYLQSRPPRFEDRFHKVVTLTGSADDDEDYTFPNSAVWLGSDTLLINVDDGTPEPYERVSISRRTKALDMVTTQALAPLHLESDLDDREVVASPDGRWLLVTYASSKEDKDRPWHCLVLSVDGKTKRSTMSTLHAPMVAWLRDSRHWVELTPKELVTHDVEKPEIFNRTPARLPECLPFDFHNTDGTESIDGACSSEDQPGEWGPGLVTPDGHISVGGTSIDPTTTPVTARHVANLPPHTIHGWKTDIGLAIGEAPKYGGHAVSLARKRIAYVTLDLGEYTRKPWVPDWVPLPSRRRVWTIWVCDIDGKHPRALAIANHVKDTGPIPITWSPDGQKLVVIINGALWETDVD